MREASQGTVSLGTPPGRPRAREHRPPPATSLWQGDLLVGVSVSVCLRLYECGERGRSGMGVEGTWEDRGYKHFTLRYCVCFNNAGIPRVIAPRFIAFRGRCPFTFFTY